LKIGKFEVGEYVVKDVGGKKHLVLDCKNCVYGSSLADDPACRFHVFSVQQETDCDLIVLADVYERVYDEQQTLLMKDVAQLSKRFETESVWSYAHLGTQDSDCEPLFGGRHDVIVRVAHDLITSDPVLAYLTLLQEIKKEIDRMTGLGEKAKACGQVYLDTLLYLKKRFEDTLLVTKTKEFLTKLRTIPDTKEIYLSLLEAQIKPAFIGSRLLFGETEELELLDEYQVERASVQVFSHPNKTEKMYFLNPPEYTLPPDKYFVLSKTKEVVASYKPGSTSLSGIAKSRKYFERVYESTILDIAQANKIFLSPEEARELAEIVARYTVGYGILELILADKKLTDIFVDSPIGMKPLYVVHSDFGQCQTNILYTEEEASSLVSKMRAMSGRPFDEAHPVLDFDLPEMETRVAVIGKPLAPDGTAFAFRLHKVTPWTLPQFIDNKFINPLGAGLLSFFIDQQATMLITGSRGSGKTSLLQALMLEILQNARVITQEDSVTGDSHILVERNGRMEYATVGELIDGLVQKYGHIDVNGIELLDSNPEDVRVFSLDSNGKTRLARVSQFSRHAVTKDIFKVSTASGKQLKVTKDHSLFGLNTEGRIVPLRTCDLKVGDRIATPLRLPLPEFSLGTMSALHLLEKIPRALLYSVAMRAWIHENWTAVKKLAKKNDYGLSMPSAWKRLSLLPACIFFELQKKNPYHFSDLRFTLGRNAKPIPVEWVLDDDFLAFCGLWLADGCYDGKFGVIVSVGDPALKAVVQSVAVKANLIVRQHSDHFSSIISNINLVFLLKNLFGLKGNAYTKKIPLWAFSLLQRQRGVFLKGLFSGDGYATDKEIGISLCSKELINQLHTLLLSFGIVPRTRRFVKKDKTFVCKISHVKNMRLFREYVGFLEYCKDERLQKLCMNNPSHDVSDVIPLSSEIKEKLANEMKEFNRHDYVNRGYQLGRGKLLSLLKSNQQQSALLKQLGWLANADIFWDEIVSIEKVEEKIHTVYDFSVPECENFVCENILAHNTLELPVEYMKSVGFNIQRLKTRSPISVSKSETEVGPAESLRTALRLGDSALVIGEVRSKEARVLYEAMRVGAAGNIVLGTIHGDSAYSVWDRVVNDLQVPTTSFKATDAVVVARPIRFSGSLKRARRVVEITEIKKHWTKDPDEEGGLLDLMLYTAKEDKLVFQEDSLKDSELFQKISRTSGLNMNEMWTAIKSNASAKAFLVDLKNKYGLSQLLEAENYAKCNNKYMLLREEQLELHKSVDYDELLGKWKFWVQNSMVKRLLEQKNRQKK
jgi:type IV secretory pathway ATPase VirB11/archaellum biosynthesis ATPase/intein/homing endonuclease